MRKNALFLVAITTCSLAFTACSKVEAPYVKPEEPTVPSKHETPKDGKLLSEDFTTTLGSFTTVTTAGLENGRLTSKQLRLRATTTRARRPPLVLTIS